MSIVEFYKENSEPYLCGYCKTNGAVSVGKFRAGMHAYTMTPEHYQLLINRGWRRSGDYIYKMVMNKTCCPAYSIRCDACYFEPSKSQRQVLKKIHNYLVFGQGPGPKDSAKNTSSESRDSNVLFDRESSSKLKKTCKKLKMGELSRQEITVTSTKKYDTPTVSTINSPNSNTSLKLTDIYPHPTKAKFFRIKKKVDRLMKRLKCTELEAINFMVDERREQLSKLKVRSFEEFFDYSESSDPAHRLDISFVPVHADSQYGRWDESYHLFKKYQTTIHKEEPSQCQPKNFKSFLNKNPFQKPRSFCETNDLSRTYGTYHMLYRLDGVLIAVGVLDVLPESISSVYLFYDPDYNFLNLGTYSALREIYFCRQINKISPSIKYYMMGLYIHSCVKMKYKAKFIPSYLLCYEAMTWHPFEQCLPLLESSKSPRLNPDTAAVDQDGSDISDKDITILIYDFENQRPDRAISYSEFKSQYGESEKIPFYAKLVGRTLAKAMNLLMVPEYGIV